MSVSVRRLWKADCGGRSFSTRRAGPSKWSYGKTPFRFNRSLWTVWASRLVNASLGKLATSFSKDADINCRLSMKRNLPSENEIYFVILLAITLMRPGWRPRAGAIRCASYPRKLWKTTGTSIFDPFAFFPLKCNRRLHLLCAAPRYARVRWSWSRTICVPSFPQIWQVVAEAKSSLSASDITIGTGQSTVALMSLCSYRSAERKLSTTSGPRYTTGLEM